MADKIPQEIKECLKFPQYVENVLNRPIENQALEIDRIMVKLMRVQKLFDEGKLNDESYRYITIGFLN